MGTHSIRTFFQVFYFFLFFIKNWKKIFLEKKIKLSKKSKVENIQKKEISISYVF